MMSPWAKVAIDSNILVYCELEPDSEKGAHCQTILEMTAPRGVLAVQASLEFLAVVRRRRPQNLASAIAKTRIWSKVFEMAPTTPQVAELALELNVGHNFQVWDAVIWSAAYAMGARTLLSEDMQDGLELRGMRVLNPFKLDLPTLREQIDA